MSLYALHDPRTGACRYVGRSLRPRLRWRQHCIRSHSPRVRAWVDELRAAGLTPDLRPLVGGSENEWIERLAPDLNTLRGCAHEEPIGDPEARRGQLPPVSVSDEKYKDAAGRAQKCGLNLTDYIRYRVYGKRVLTGEQLEAVKEHEELID